MRILVIILNESETTFPRAARIKGHRLGGLKERKHVLSLFWRLKPQNQRVGGAMVCLTTLGEGPSLPLPLCGSLRFGFGFLVNTPVVWDLGPTLILTTKSKHDYSPISKSEHIHRFRVDVNLEGWRLGAHYSTQYRKLNSICDFNSPVLHNLTQSCS